MLKKEEGNEAKSYGKNVNKNCQKVQSELQQRGEAFRWYWIEKEGFGFETAKDE